MRRKIFVGVLLLLVSALLHTSTVVADGPVPTAQPTNTSANSNEATYKVFLPTVHVQDGGEWEDRDRPFGTAAKSVKGSWFAVEWTWEPLPVPVIRYPEPHFTLIMRRACAGWGELRLRNKGTVYEGHWRFYDPWLEDGERTRAFQLTKTYVMTHLPESADSGKYTGACEEE